MKNILVLLFLITGIAGSAQLKGFGFGPFIEAGQPTGNFRETNKNGIGAGLGADIRLGRIGITGSVGYMHFGGNTIDKGNGNVKMPALNALPIRAGLKYRLAPAIYAKFESGVARFTGTNESSLIISPGVGVRILGLDLQAKYEVWKKQEAYSFWGLKAGFNF
ncbi:MAG: hypothetical protein ABI675_11855 [Chitinophagaceae bacterium]